MKWQLFAVAILFAVLVADSVSAADKPRKLKKFRKRPVVNSGSDSMASGEDVFSMLEHDDKAAVMAQSVEKLPAIAEETHNEVDPCSTKRCGAGRVCSLDSEGQAQCGCIVDCPEEEDPRRRVCTNRNTTQPSDCHVYRARCRCEKAMPSCAGPEDSHLHIEYYGECRDMPSCLEEEKADFPRRMRDWLFNIMRDLADRRELSSYYLKMEREAETNLTRRWTNAAVWKWCDLDGHPHDRSVSRHELFPIRAPLMSLEHCIAPFLNGCDSNDDHRITLAEWGKCLELDPEDLEDRCEEIREFEG